MTATQVVAPATVLVPHPSTGPLVRSVVARVAVSLATAVIAPAVLVWSTLVLFNVATAVIAALAWMIGATSWRWATKRPVSVLLLLTLLAMTIRTAFTLATGNTFVYFVQPVFTDVTVAAIFLGSLWTARPVVARLAPDFFPLDDAIAEQPVVRAHFRRLTLMWGLVILVKGSITLWLLESLSTAHFVLIKSGATLTLTLTATTVTVVWSVIVARQEGLLHPTPG
jgi:hypothetical protein